MYLSPRVSPLMTAHDPRYLGALSLVALPFIWIGVSLSVRRLRDAGLSPFWAGALLRALRSLRVLHRARVLADGSAGGAEHA